MSELDDDCDDGVDDWNPSTFNPSLSLNALDLMAEDEAIGATQALSGLTSPLDLVRSRGSRQRNALDRLSSLNTSDTGSLSRRYSLGECEDVHTPNSWGSQEFCVSLFHILCVRMDTHSHTHIHVYMYIHSQTTFLDLLSKVQNNSPQRFCAGSNTRDPSFYS
mgnify:FL=1